MAPDRGGGGGGGGSSGGDDASDDSGGDEVDTGAAEERPWKRPWHEGVLDDDVEEELAQITDIFRTCEMTAIMIPRLVRALGLSEEQGRELLHKAFHQDRESKQQLHAGFLESMCVCGCPTLLTLQLVVCVHVLRWPCVMDQ